MNHSDDSTNERLRSLPGVDRVLDALKDESPAAVLTGTIRTVLDSVRKRVLDGKPAPSFEEIVAAVRADLSEDGRRRLQPVINATGVLIHTNLGRAPIGDEQLAAGAVVARGYSNLEYDLVDGHRGSRYSHVRSGLAALTGAESALVVNNNAAAVLLVLSALCRDREVIISRGELIEIGGEFRIPDVMALSGARLVEVGTTNRTHLSDYEKAITQNTAAILKVHPSNYRVVGFTASVPSRDLARLARGRGVCFFHDVGSGLIEAPEDATWAAAEPEVRTCLREGADLVTFSGDKLLGGPQAGVIVGRADLVTRLERHPLLRALRVDKLGLAALDATVGTYLSGRQSDLPLWQLALTPATELERRAGELVRKLEAAGIKVDAIPTSALVGGGSVPGTDLPSWAVVVVHEAMGADELHRALRHGSPAVVGRVEDDRLLLDLRSVPAELDKDLERAIVTACSQS